jgi:hypothetical protein
MNISAELDALDQLVVEDPQMALPRIEALVNRKPKSARAMATLGNNYRLLGRLLDAEDSLKTGLRLPATTFDRAQLLCWYSLLCYDRQEWPEALAKLDEASALHGLSPGLPGPPDRLRTSYGELVACCASSVSCAPPSPGSRSSG